MTQFWLWLAGRRTLVQLLATLSINSYVTQGITKSIPCLALNCHSCPAAAFACPIGTIQHFVIRRRFPLYVLGVVGLAGVLIGRGSCGWFCPFGWLQELVYKIPAPKLRLPNRFNWTRYAVLVGLVVLVPLVSHEPWFCKLCPAGVLEAGIPMVFLSADIRALVGPLFWIKIGILGLFLAWMAVTRRPFCRWVCPLGALWSPFNPVSLFRLEVDQERCSQCNQCQEVCPVDIKVHENPNSDACIRCLACVRGCTQGCVSVASLTRDRDLQTERVS